MQLDHGIWERRRRGEEGAKEGGRRRRAVISSGFASLLRSAMSAHVPFLIAGMIITGSSNSLWTKWQVRSPRCREHARRRLTRRRRRGQDMRCVENCNDPNPAHHVLYEQPVWQTLQMFGKLRSLLVALVVL